TGSRRPAQPARPGSGTATATTPWRAGFPHGRRPPPAATRRPDAPGTAAQAWSASGTGTTDSGTGPTPGYPPVGGELSRTPAAARALGRLPARSLQRATPLPPRLP